MPAERPTIHHDSITTRIVQAHTASAIGLARRRFAMIGGVDPEDKSHLQLGALSQVEGFVRIEQGTEIDRHHPIEPGTCRVDDAFRMSRHFLSVSITELEGDTFDADEIRRGFVDADKILVGPFSHPTRQEERAHLDSERLSLWVPIAMALGTDWFLTVL